jgi:hypothetical protein
MVRNSVASPGKIVIALFNHSLIFNYILIAKGEEGGNREGNGLWQ